MGRVVRFDVFAAGALAPPQKTQEGWLRVEGKIGRTGIQIYYDMAGNARRELRLPEEVFAEEAMASFRMVPTTNRHPPKLLDAEDAKEYATGAVGENVRKLDDAWLGAPMLIHDGQAIRDVESGRAQLSCGYTCELDSTQSPELIKQWGEYDYIQRKIRGNHVATVDAARAGPDARIRLDELDATAAAMLASEKSEPPKEKPTMGLKIKLDGFEIEVADANAAAIIERSVLSARQAGEAAAKQAGEKLDAAEKVVAAQKTQLSELQAKHDELKAKIDKLVQCDECSGKGKIDGAQCEGCTGKGELNRDDSAEGKKRRADSMQRIVARGVASRVKLEGQARKILGEDAKLDGKSESEIKKECVKAKRPDAKLDEVDAVYLQGRFDSVLEEAEKGSAQETAADKLKREAMDAERQRAAGKAPKAPESIEEAQRRFAKNLDDAWKPKQA